MNNRHVVRCAKCEANIPEVNAHYITVLWETAPVLLCWRCFNTLVNPPKTKTYNIYVENTDIMKVAIEATSVEEARRKFDDGEYDELEFVDSYLSKVVEIAEEEEEEE